jgi:hypothetical protein
VLQALVRIGPWTLTRVERLEGTEPSVKCERCSTTIREIRCLTIDTSDEELAKHNVARDWRVGNDRGPQLIEETEARWHDSIDDAAGAWKRCTRDVNSRLDPLLKIDRVVAAAASKGVELSISRELSEAREKLLTGTLRPDRERRIGNLVKLHGRALGLCTGSAGSIGSGRSERSARHP